MLKITKATEQEQKDYRGPYSFPLYGFVEVSGQKCAIELPSQCGDDDPKYEVLAPKGFCWSGDPLHSLLCFTMADLRERLASERLVACPADCDCRDEDYPHA